MIIIDAHIDNLANLRQIRCEAKDHATNTYRNEPVNIYSITERT